MSTLNSFSITPRDIQRVGADLRRPECVLAGRDGSLFVSDARGGVTRIAPDGRQSFVAQRHAGESASDARPSVPNGLAFAARGAGLLVANFARRRLEAMQFDGATTVLLEGLAGEALGQVNFVLRDASGRLWITVSTQHTPFFSAFRPDVADGQILVIDAGGARVVAEGLRFPNEVRVHPSGQWLYVAETTGKRVRRFRIGADNALTEPEIVGRADLGAGFPDGIAFDSEANLWVAMVGADRLIVIRPDGSLVSVIDEGDSPARRAMEKAFGRGELQQPQLAAAAGTIAPLMTSIAFAGADLKDVYLGSLLGQSLARFRSPVAGTSLQFDDISAP